MSEFKPAAKWIQTGSNIYNQNQTGGVAIGTTTASAQLTVSGGTTALQIHASGLANALTIISGGNVGIGTTGPGNLLHVYGGADGVFTSVVKIDGAIGTIGVGKGIDFNTFARIGGVNDASSTTSFQVRDTSNNVKLYVGTGGTYNGNVGIGTTSPTGQLTLSGATLPIVVHGTGQANIIYVSGNGNVGIGTTSPLGLLHIASGTTSLRVDASGIAPTTVGTASTLIGSPTIWLTINVSGTNYRFPGYAV